MKSFLIALVFTFAGVSPALAADIAPDAFARSVTDEVLAIIRADKDLQSGNREKLMKLAEAKLLPHFNFPRMTQLAVGRSWRQATPEQQKILIEEFRNLLVRTYTTAFTQYRNETVDYRPARMSPGDTDVVVKSLINRPGGQPIAVDYNMEKSGASWKVYDVKIENVSLVENYRNTFNSEIQRSGVDGLIKVLTDKNRMLASQASAKP
jgi:phospholipid transport system substrate-binding protein